MGGITRTDFMEPFVVLVQALQLDVNVAGGAYLQE